jgi:hypothetical protein
MHVPLGMFEMNEMIGQSMVTQLHSLLEKFGLLHIVFDFVKIEGINLVAMATTVHFIIDYDLLKSFRVYEGTWFGHVMSKACQSDTNDNKVSTRLQHVNVKDARIGLQKSIT